MTSKNFNTNTKTIINKSLNLNTMKNNYFKNTLKLGMTAIFIMALGTANAQTTTGDGASVRVIDNKGTIKYLQTNNGITSITSTDLGNKTTTTWQLGGTLASNTDIDLAGNTFSLDRVIAIDGSSSAAENIAATSTSLLADGSKTGYTIIVRDEATGALKKMLASDLITGGQVLFPIVADTDVVVTAAGLADGTDIYKISVYRNGNKLRGGTDYTLTAANTITLAPNSVPPNDWSTFAGDVIEVQWVN
jgi:hypothetical protein